MLAVVGGVFLFILGVLGFLRPLEVWNITERWKTKDGAEPTELYLFSIRFSGAVLAVLGLVCTILLFILD